MWWSCRKHAKVSAKKSFNYRIIRCLQFRMVILAPTLVRARDNFMIMVNEDERNIIMDELQRGKTSLSLRMKAP